jgi:hypothetical protein
MTVTLPSRAAVLPFQPKRSPERFLKLRHAFVESELQKLPGLFQALYVRIAVRHNGNNNGRIAFSIRDGVAAVHAHKSTVGRGLKRLEVEGLIVCTKRGRFDRKTQEAKASEWFLPEYGPLAQKDNHQFPLERPVGLPGGNRPPSSIPSGDTPLDKKERIDIDKESALKAIQEERGLPRKEEPPTSPSDSQPSSPSQFNGVSRPVTTGGGGIPRRQISFTSPEMELVEQYCRATGRSFFTGRSGGVSLTDEEWAAVVAATNDGGVP